MLNSFRLRCSVALVVLVLGTMPAAAQSIPDTLFDAPTRIELERIISSARQSGLPTAPLINRALQGAARKVDGNRVLMVVRSYADSMKVALTLLGGGSGESEIDAAAAALRAGVSRDGIRQVRRTRGTGQATTALIVLTDLVRRGVAPADAATAVTTVAQSQPDNALLSLQSAIAREAAAPTAAQLREAVQRQLRQRPPVPDGTRSDALVRALDGRTSPSVGHTAYLALSAFNPAPATAGVWTAFEGGLSLPLGSGLALSAGARAGSDVTDSLVMQLRGGVSFTRAVGSRSAVASWLGIESRPWQFAATPGASDDSLQGGDLESRFDMRDANGIAFVGGTSVARTVSPRLALGALVELQSDRIVTRSLVPRFLEPIGPRPDTLRPIGYDEHLESAQRLFVHSALNAVIGQLALQGTFVHRLRGPGSSGEATRSLFTLSAEHHVAGGMNLFASMSSREPTDVLGAVLPTDGRVRLGARFVERRAVKPPQPDPAPAAPMSLTLERATAEGARATVRVALRVPSARQVLVEGDFTDWRPAALTLGADGRFGGIFAVKGEVVRLRVRIDDGPWQVPPGLAVDVDDFGGLVGVALVR
jgi:hypothetical protein